ncbi:MAG TPA: FAD-dependent monooxygenase [Solirubrobacteraceae bacterium]|jgi:2-polyprenyl-6-methoxyphenol hydroxylase-like FAD-dependent oxidoreductase|nr:FAD-dependent monooxygenase [Solirubrobacteraceae bacterium]
MRVLVIGGGMAGLSATLSLRGAGIEVDVIERDPAWGVYGVGIIQPANALRALDVLGVAQECVVAGHPIRGDRTWLGDGVTQIATHAWPTLVDGLPPGNGITRPRLHEILKAATGRSGANVRTGVTASAIEDVGDQVEVAFSDGAEGTYDLVVGADGLYSQTRGQLLGPGLEPRFTGQVCWRYNLPRIEGLEEIWVFIGPHGTLGFVPIGRELMYAFLIETPAPGQADAIKRDGAAATMRRRLEPFAGPIADLREQIDDDRAVVLRPIEAILVPEPWFRGRVVLIGDAVHGTSPHAGQGAAQALDDGIVLGQELGRDVPLEQALQAFSTRRFERCKIVVEGSLAIGSWEQDHSLPIDPDATRAQVAMSAAMPI